MLSIKRLTRKLGRQTLSEVKPAPASETVDHTLPEYMNPCQDAADESSVTLLTPEPEPQGIPSCSLSALPSRLSTESPSSSDSETDEGYEQTQTTKARTRAHQSRSQYHSSVNSQQVIAGRDLENNLLKGRLRSPRKKSLTSELKIERVPSAEKRKYSQYKCSTGRLRSPRKKSLTSELKIERVPSAEKRKYSQYKCSTGSSSNASSSDDEIKEAFEGYSCLRQSSYVPPQCPSYSWTFSKDNKADQAFMWNPDPFVANRPVKVVPVGHKKPKFFAQMSASHNERPHLDFNKMQHSKRLIMVRRPVVIRNNSKVHSIHRPPTLQVSLDISQHSFQPVLTQT